MPDRDMRLRSGRVSRRPFRTNQSVLFDLYNEPGRITIRIPTAAGPAGAMAAQCVGINYLVAACDPGDYCSCQRPPPM